MACFKGCGHILCLQCANSIIGGNRACHQCRARVPQVNKIQILFKSKNFITELNRNITGIRDGKNINFDDIKHIQIPINPEKKENSSLIVEKCIIFKKDYIKNLEELKLSFIANVCLGNIDINSLKK